MSNPPKEIFYIQNAANQDAFANMSSDLDQQVWRYGVLKPSEGWDIEDPKPIFWSDFIGNRWHDAVFQSVVDKLEEIDPNTKNYIFKMFNAQAGGRVQGMEGSIHVDHNFEFSNGGDGFMTFCYFPNKEWEPEWGGELQFYGDNGEIIASYLPMPNTCIVFDSNIPHRGLAPTKECPVLRKHVSMKVQVHKMSDTTSSIQFTDLTYSGNDTPTGQLPSSEV